MQCGILASTILSLYSGKLNKATISAFYYGVRVRVAYKNNGFQSLAEANLTRI